MDELTTIAPACPRLRALGLDLMDTILVDPWVEAVEAVTGLGVVDSRPLRDRAAWADFELGTIDEAEYARRFFLPQTGLVLDLPRLKAEFARLFRFVDGMEELLADAAARWPVHVLSNYPPWYEGLRARFALDRFVAGHHPSYVVGARKPAAAYFERALARIGCAPGELLFVDDREDNVRAARALGVPSLLFVGAGPLRAVLGLSPRGGAPERGAGNPG